MVGEMDKVNFIETLKSTDPSNGLKQECLQYFVDNYPVQINVRHPFFGTVVGKTWTSLEGYQVKNDKKAMNKLDENYNKLVERIKEIEDYDKE
jgi:hypothetical protein